MDGKSFDAIVVGAGLAGLVAAAELTSRGRRVVVVEQENRANLGAQAHWSFGGLFLVDSPEQRRLRVRDSLELAWQDWCGSAQWDRLEGEANASGEPLGEDVWGKRWARAYVEWAAGGKREWLRENGIELTPMVGWAERGDGRAGGHGNSVPRFHIAWGTGTGVSGPFVEKVLDAEARGLLTFAHRHRVDELIVETPADGGARAVTGVRGSVLAPDDAERGVASNRDVVGGFEFTAPSVIVASGGIGGNHDLVRRWWPADLGEAPRSMLTGVPAYVDGRMLEIAADAGARLVNRDRMWHYTEGIRNWNPVWPQHAIRILPGPSPLWFDAIGRRMPMRCLPGFDTRGTLRHLRSDPAIRAYDHSWFIVTQPMLEKEFALSGSEQNLDLTSGSRREVVRARLAKGAPRAVADFVEHGEDFVVAETLEELVAKMNELTDEPLLDAAHVRRQIEERDAQVDNAYGKDVQVMAIHNARRYLGDRLARVSAPHRVLDERQGPLVGIKLHVLTRKSLGGIQTDLDSRVLDARGRVVPGLFAAGEAAGFGGGGVHGFNALEGTFLGGCLFSGRAAGVAASRVA
ncbi:MULTISPECIES: FAD-binding dehydrogenase [Dermacoccus]|uniref:FAD-binding dehydrogenase n=1 Tax=Dermacoccus TaxID=57495 RepID=UPI000783A289|nr:MULTISPECIES: FAD-binding dehydrogenase [Dermacoccus]MCG7430458.1 FAD-binding dehydrogenase [Dermacoccus nishinomiyaensis]MCI0153385.1 FAD-binding dehydrogenase [Dermacoccus nishinomiyaensis]MCT1605506.1 FAD-binding dehydrogenase [Dermacoccus nishinomiyaensis]